MSYREHKISKQADMLREGVYDGAMGPVAMFAEYLIGKGALGLDMTLHASTTVEQMVEHYVSDIAGQRELNQWAHDEARDQQDDAEIQEAV